MGKTGDWYYLGIWTLPENWKLTRVGNLEIYEYQNLTIGEIGNLDISRL